MARNSSNQPDLTPVELLLLEVGEVAVDDGWLVRTRDERNRTAYESKMEDLYFERFSNRKLDDYDPED